MRRGFTAHRAAGRFIGLCILIALLSRRTKGARGSRARAMQQQLRQLAWHATPTIGHRCFPAGDLIIGLRSVADDSGE